MRPCPYCESDDISIEGSNGEYQAQCQNCGHSTKPRPTISLVIKYWNKKSMQLWDQLEDYREMMAG